MKLKQKLILGFVAVSLLVGFAGILGLYANQQTIKSYESGEKHFGTIVEASTEVSSFAKRAEGHVMLFLTLHNESDKQKFFARINSLREQNAIIEGTVKNPGAKRILEDIKSKTDELQSVGESLIEICDNDMKTAGGFDPEKNEKLIRKLNTVASEIRENGVNLAKLEVDLKTEYEENAKKDATSLQNIILTLSGAAVFSALVLGYVIARNIANPVMKLKEAAVDIGRGNLGTRTEIKSKDEIGELARTFNKMAEDLERSREEQYRRLVEHSPDGIAVHSEGKLVFINPAGAKLLGASDPEQLIGKPITDFLHPDYHEIVEDRVQEVRDGNDAPLTEEKFIRPDGSVIDIEVAAMPFTHKGKPAIQAVFRDITQKKITQKIQLENERLAYANKAKSEFLATMSHELRTPLNSIIGFSELLKQKTFGELNGKQEHYVENVLASGKFLLSLISDILDLTLIEAGKLEIVTERFEVIKTINEVTSLIKEKASKHNIVLKEEFDPRLDFIEADQRRFKQILFNLLDNAVKFSKNGGGTVTIAVKKEGDMAKFSVWDNGIGIREEDMPRLFEKFLQIDSGITRNYGGTGLGLAISKELVEMQGGKIMAESRYGEGSTFTFLLPIVANKAGEIK